jgi:hypothetical protein
MPHLKKIQTGITIKATKGTETISKSGFCYIDSDFKNWGCDVPSVKTKKIEVDIYEQEIDGTYQDIFNSFGVPLENLCLTQEQIIDYCQENKDKINTYTHFLFKVGNEFFVAHVCVYSDGQLNAYVYRFSHVDVWGAGVRIRFVVPQLDTKSPSKQTLSLSKTLPELLVVNGIKYKRI